MGEPVGDIFVAVWVKYHLSKEDASELKQLLISDDTDAFLKTLIASALVLGSLHCYDERKLDILADIADGCGGNVLFDDGLRGIAMTGVALVLASYPVRGAASGDLRSRIELWRDDERLSKDMRLVVRGDNKDNRYGQGAEEDERGGDSGIDETTPGHNEAYARRFYRLGCQCHGGES